MSLFSLDYYGLWMLALYIPLDLIDALLQSAGNGVEFLHRAGFAVGLMGAMYLSSAVALRETLCKSLVALAGSSFLVYTAHESVLTILRKVAVYTTHPLQGGLIILHIGLPVCLAVTLVFLHRLLGGGRK